MKSIGVRELKNNLSQYIRRAEAGERIAVTAHGRVVAELVPPGANIGTGRNRYDQLVAAGVIRPAIKKGPLPNWPSLKLPPGTAKAILDWSRGED